MFTLRDSNGHADYSNQVAILIGFVPLIGVEPTLYTFVACCSSFELQR
jgi:hypothetical protein